MKKGIYLLPNIITLSSMFSGFYSIVASFNSDYERAAWAILIASVFDVLDGHCKKTKRFPLTCALFEQALRDPALAKGTATPVRRRLVELYIVELAEPGSALPHIEALLGEGIPLIAVGAFAQPLGRLVAAALAGKNNLGLRHRDAFIAGKLHKGEESRGSTV